MLPHLANNDGESGHERPSLPSIRELFGEHLSKPVNKRPSPFSLAELGSSLPTESRSTSPAESQGSSFLSSTLTSPRSAWSQGSGQPYTTPSTSSRRDEFITLPPINAPYSESYRDSGRRVPSPYLMTSSQRISNSHSRSRSTSEAVSEATRGHSPISRETLDPSAKRRHTIGSSRGSSSSSSSSMARLSHHAMEQPPPPRYSGVPTSSLSKNAIPTGLSLAAHGTNPYPTGSTHPSMTHNLPPVGGNYPSASSCPPSPPSTSGEEVSTERRKTPAKYECQYCKKRFNRPSSLKLHHNTHTGEKPYACSFPGCGRHFSVMSNMRRHARIHGEPSSATRRESSVEDNIEASTPYSSSSSTHDPPVISQTTLVPRSSSELYSRSHSPSASSSSHHHQYHGHIQSTSLSLSSSSSRFGVRRHHSHSRPHPYSYRRSQSPMSDQDRSSPE